MSSFRALNLPQGALLHRTIGVRTALRRGSGCSRKEKGTTQDVLAVQAGLLFFCGSPLFSYALNIGERFGSKVASAKGRDTTVSQILFEG